MLASVLFYAYKQRTKSNKILKEITTMRAIFYTNITHELRTPLTVILGLTNKLQQSQEITRNESNYYLNAIYRQGNHLLRLVNQLLKLAKINSGMEVPQWRRGNIVFYIQMIIDSLKHLADTKHINLIYKYSSLNIEMDFVPYYIEDILQNLVSNAIKYSPTSSSINITANSNTKELFLKVSDNGIGIPENEIEHIFNYFYQGSNSDRNNGSGIGLRYTQQLVENMNGKISVESKLGVGTQLIVVLPLRQSKIEEIKHLDETSYISNPKIYQTDYTHYEESEKHSQLDEFVAKTNSTKPTSILIIDDNDDVIIYLIALLQNSHNIFYAHNGEMGINMAHKHKPDLIISDIMMPFKDGFDLCSEIRSSEILSHIPIIILTARASSNDQVKGLKHGADAYIVKPFDPNELIAQIERLINNRQLLKNKYIGTIIKENTDVNKENNAFLQKVIDIINAEISNKKLNTIFLADKLNISNSQLNRRVTSSTGYSSSGYITQIRIEKAKHKLVNEDKPISQVAAECGFYDTAHFSRTFKQITNVTPTQFKNSHN